MCSSKRTATAPSTTSPRTTCNFQRLEREFKEGFGRPEWGWPPGVPKLKTIAQIFKEQGGFEIVATIKGAALIGRPYRGPFDDLPAQNANGGVPEDANLKDRNGGRVATA